MKSIQSKLILLIMIALFVTSFFVGGVGLRSFHKAIDEKTVKLLNWTCQEKAQELNNIMTRMENAVEILSVYALENLESVERFQNDQEYLKDYTQRMDGLAHTIVNETDGAVAIYMRFAPELVGPLEGFFRVKNPVTGKYEPSKLTDISQYEESDIEHLGWYYIPIQAGEPIWLEPYSNENICMNMISYVVPLYKEGHLIGVVGMDIDFEYIIEQIKAIQIYETGHAFITDRDFKIVYSEHYTVGTSIREYSEDLKTAEAEEILGMDTLYEIKFGGIVRKMAFSQLGNDMCLAVIVPEPEVNVTKDKLTSQVLISSIILVIVFMFFAWITAKNIVRPLRQLNEAAKQIAEGNLDVELDCKSKDEVGTLANSLKETVAQLKIRIDYINNLAYVDKLTGVNNNTAYLQEVALTKVAMEKGQADFGVFVVDVNGLKSINDEFGHAAGNELIIGAAKTLTEVFNEKCVYRIGGDEFAVAVKNVDDTTCQNYMLQFERRLKNRVGNVKIVAAMGYAIYDKISDMNYDNVFQRADEMMYQNKESMKARGENSQYYT